MAVAGDSARRVSSPRFLSLVFPPVSGSAPVSQRARVRSVRTVAGVAVESAWSDWVVSA